MSEQIFLPLALYEHRLDITESRFLHHNRGIKSTGIPSKTPKKGRPDHDGPRTVMMG
jgi:hypothetical protein